MASLATASVGVPRGSAVAREQRGLPLRAFGPAFGGRDPYRPPTLDIIRQRA